MEEHLHFKIDWASLIVGIKFSVFALFYFVFEGNFQVQAPGGLIFEGAIHGGSFALLVWRAYIWRGLCVEGLIFGILWCLPKPKAEVIIIDLLATDKSRYFAQPYPTIVLASG